MSKNFKTVKILFGLAVFCLVFAVASCKQEPKPEDSKEAAEDINEVNAEVKDSVTEAKVDDSEYLIAAAETDLAEIEIGKLAQSKGTDSGVKDFGKMLVADHTKSLDGVKAAATKRSIAIPLSITEKGKEHYDELAKEKAGKDFDTKFADMMVKGHEDAISKMEEASNKANDPELKSWAANMVPTLKGHLEHAKMLQDKIKNKYK